MFRDFQIYIDIHVYINYVNILIFYTAYINTYLYIYIFKININLYIYIKQQIYKQ